MKDDQITIGKDIFQVGNPIKVFSSSPSLESIKPSTKVEALASGSPEISVKRTADSKTFELEPGKFRVVSGKTPIHYVDAQGNWQDIDLTIQQEGKKFIMTKAPYQVELFTDKVGYRFIGKDGEWFTIELVKIDGIEVDNQLLKVSVDTVQIFWEGLAPGLSFKALLLAQQPEIFTKIDDADAGRSFTWMINQSSPREFRSFGFDNADDSLEMLITQEEIDVNTILYTETWTGRVSRIVRAETRQKRWFSDPVYPVIIDPTITENIPAGAEDGAIDYNGAWKATQNYMGPSASDNYVGGFRFTSVAVPVGAIVTSATFKVKTKAGFNFGVGTLAVKGNKIGDALAWSTTTPRDAVKTTASTVWNPVATSLNSIDVTAQIIEIIALGAWASGNAIGIIVDENVGTRVVSFSDYEASPANAASLVIDYTAGGGGSDPAPVPPQIISW